MSTRYVCSYIKSTQYLHSQRAHFPSLPYQTRKTLFTEGEVKIDLRPTTVVVQTRKTLFTEGDKLHHCRFGFQTDLGSFHALDAEQVQSSDLIAYGLVPKFVGRFPILVNLLNLTENGQLVQVKLHYTEGDLRLIASKGITMNTGARGLRALLENILMDAMYEIPDATTGKDIIEVVVVDEEAVGVKGLGCGAKILNGEGSFDEYLSEQALKDRAADDGDEVAAEAELPSIAAL